MSAPKPVADISPWTPFEDRRRARDEKRDAVLRMAVRLFLEEGYHRTPLARIAERLNITKPALYNYFASKEEILYALYRLGDEQYEESFGRIERGERKRTPQTPRNDPRLCPHHDDGFRHVLRPPRRPRARREPRAEVRRSKRRYDLAFRKQIERGIEDGSIKPCNPKLAAFAIGGALNGIADWYRPRRRPLG